MDELFFHPVPYSRSGETGYHDSRVRGMWYERGRRTTKELLFAVWKTRTVFGYRLTTRVLEGDIFIDGECQKEEERVA